MIENGVETKRKKRERKDGWRLKRIQRNTIELIKEKKRAMIGKDYLKLQYYYLNIDDKSKIMYFGR